MNKVFIFYYKFTDTIKSQINNYDTSIHFVLKKKLATALRNDIQSVVYWFKKLLVNFNGSRTMLLIFNPQREPFPLFMRMRDSNFWESIFRLLSRTFLLTWEIILNQFLILLPDSVSHQNLSKAFIILPLVRELNIVGIPGLLIRLYISIFPYKTKRRVCNFIDPDLLSIIQSFRSTNFFCKFFLLKFL